MKVMSRSFFVLTAAAILLAAPAAMAQVDLYTMIEETNGGTVNAGDIVNYTVTYGNQGDTDANNPYVNAFFPPNIPASLDILTDDDVAAITATVVSSLGEPLMFLDSTYCEGIYFQVQCEDDTARPCPIDGLNVGVEGGFTFDVTMPTEQPISPTFRVNSPADIAGDWIFARSGCGAGTDNCGAGDCFGPRMSVVPAVTTMLELVDDGTGALGSQGCNPLVGFTPGNVAMVDRGNCEFGQKVLMAQQAGAVGTVIVNSEVPSPDSTILFGGGDFGALATIPVIMITLNQGAEIKPFLDAGVEVTFGAAAGDVITWETTVFTSPDEGDADESNDGSFLSTTINFGATVDPPVAGFTYAPMDPEEGEMIQFTDTSTNTPTAWAWDFGGMGTSTDQNPTYTFDTAGTYTVSLTATNDGGSDTATMDVTVTEVGTVTLDNFYFIPAAAKAAGAEGSFFVTDMVINNAGMDMATYQFLWLPRNTDNAAPAGSDMFTLGAGMSVVYEDVLGEVFGVTDGAVGALAVISDGMDLKMMSRTYNATADGTFGQSIPGFAMGDLIPANERMRIVWFSENDAYRSNLGLLNGTGTPLRIFWERFAADGTSIEQGFTDLAAWGNTQINRVFEDEMPIAGAYVDVWTTTDGGYFGAYGSLLDNMTSDPTTILPQ